MLNRTRTKDRWCFNMAFTRIASAMETKWLNDTVTLLTWLIYKKPDCWWLISTMNPQSDSLMMISFLLSHLWRLGTLPTFQQPKNNFRKAAEIHHTSSLSVMNISSHIKHFVSENVIGFDMTIRRASWNFSSPNRHISEADCWLFWSQLEERIPLRRTLRSTRGQRGWQKHFCRSLIQAIISVNARETRGGCRSCV